MTFFRPYDQRLMEALRNVDQLGDIAPPSAHDPMTMALRRNAIRAHLIRWDGAEARYALTGTGRSRLAVRDHRPADILRFRITCEAAERERAQIEESPFRL